MASYERGVGSTANFDNRGFFSKMLRSLSNWGMDADQMVIMNTNTTGRHEDITQTNTSTNMYDLFSKRVISKMLDRKSIAMLDRAYPDKRKILRQYSIKDEIKDFVNDMADECIVYDDNNFFCRVKDLPDEFDNTIKQKYQENFVKLMRKFGFTDGLTAWNYVKNFLIDGYIAFELVYDNKQKTIIDLSPIDPMTLIMATEPETGTIIWIQHPEDAINRRILLDSQIIYISYSNNSDFCETSYVENMIRPYNQLKLLEQTKLLFNINQSAIYKKFVIPTNGLTRMQAEQQIYQLMSEYHEDVQWDESTGQIQINGSRNMPLSKDIWLPSGEQGSPTIEIMPLGGTDLNEDSMLKWFRKILIKSSKFPLARNDEDGGGGSIHSDIAEITRDEIKFGKFVDRLRTVIKEMVVKPLRIQMILDFPELKDDNLFNTSINIIFNSNQLFEEWKYLNNLSKRSEILSTLSSNIQDADGKPYLSIEYLLRKIMKYTDADIAENNKYKMTGAMAGATAQGGAQGGGGMSQGGMEPQAETGGAQPQAQSGGAHPQAESGGGEAMDF